MSGLIEEFKNEVCADADRLKDEILWVSRQIHDKPELGSEEYFACNLLTSKLIEHGFDVEKEFLGMKTAFKAVYKAAKPGPRIAFLAEYDALPGVGHGCGHNIIAASIYGAALTLVNVVNSLGGEIVVYGTPAEEGHGPYGGSKIIMVDQRAFNGADVVLTMHPSSGEKVATRKQALTIKGFRVQFFGHTAHAAADPWKGVNALNGLRLMFQAIDALRQHMKKDGRIHGIIVKGGEASNVIPDYVEAAMSVRAADLAYLEELIGKFKNCALGAALATGTKVEVTPVGLLYREILLNESLAGVLEENLRKLGLVVEDPVETLLKGPLGSTDYGNVSLVAPSASVSMPISPIELPGHSKEFAEAAVSDVGNEALMKTVKALAMTSVDVLAQPGLLEKVKKEFAEKKAKLPRATAS